MNDFQNIDPEKVVSCVLINVADGYSVEEVLNAINIHVKKVKAVRTKEMISGISESLRGISDIAGFLIGGIRLFGLLILFLMFTMSVNERKKEFAVLRVIGASRKMLATVVMKEAILIGIGVGLTGTALGLLILLPFHTLIEAQLEMPFLLPDAAHILLIAAVETAITVGVSAATASCSAYRLIKTDTALILRGDN